MDPSLSTSNFRNKALKHIAIFIAILYTLDFCIGLYLNGKHKELDRGEFGLVNKIFYTAEEDILIFGSSRAKYHYDSLLIESQTGKSCYNAGFNGRGFLLSSVLIRQMLERHKPSVIVLDINFLNKTYEDEHKKLDILRPYYSEYSEVKEVLNYNAPYERLKHFSKIYPYNATVPALIERKIDKDGEDTKKGASKLQGTRLKAPYIGEPVSEVELDKDLLNRLFDICDFCKKKKVKLVVCISPALTKFNAESIKVIEEGLRGKGIDFYDFTASDLFKSPKLFYDNQHLNKFGAGLYSQKIGRTLQELLD